MAGRFEGLSALEWKLFEDVMTEVGEKRGRGMPHVPLGHVLNTLMYVLITGCRWCDVPNSCNLGIKQRSAHRWLKRWQVDGTLALLQARILGIASEKGLINWSYGAVDGSFSPWHWRW